MKKKQPIYVSIIKYGYYDQYTEEIFYVGCDKEAADKVKDERRTFEGHEDQTRYHEIQTWEDGKMVKCEDFEPNW